ncbi:peptidase M61 [Prolixibacteraceae bacterium JC049]|nr:peptidase M61 [Prolixibacteraceae bacterium JC049]
MKKILIALLIFTSLATKAQNDSYQFFVNLNEVKNDKLHVSLKTPKIKSDKIIYNIPKMIPGSYTIDDFGQYITDFKAFNKNGVLLNVTRIDTNRWEIDNAKHLAEIRYWVDDTWDADVENFVFEPCGTNIEAGTNILLNNHGFFGYFTGMKNYRYELNVTRPENFYGSTGLTTRVTNGNTDKFTTNNYMDLVDSPIMYNIPDTTVFKVGETDILISVYSKSKKITSKLLADDVKAMLELQKDYLGTLPVKKYAFIIYLFKAESAKVSTGALEHSYSSFYYNTEAPIERFIPMFIGDVAHEFFHIVTPLNIHSEEIGDFDYISPKMSKHLWLYEGVVEYFSDHVKVYGGMISPKAYLKAIKKKISDSKRYNDELPFTELSLGCLDKYKDQSDNVYCKGALIGLCLDILLREESNGKTGMKDMMKKLSDEYGKYKSFKDEELFDKITELSSPKIRTFFTEYVEGSKSLPLETILEKVGVNFKQDVKYTSFSLGFSSLTYNPHTERYFITKKGMDEFAKDLSYNINDEIVSINGKELTQGNLLKLWKEFKNNAKEGDKVKIVIARKKKDNYKNIKLKAKARIIEKTKKYVVKFNELATEDQLKLRKAWLGLE